MYADEDALAQAVAFETPKPGAGKEQQDEAML